MLIRFFVKIFVTNPVIKVRKRGRQTDASQREAWKTVDLRHDGKRQNEENPYCQEKTLDINLPGMQEISLLPAFEK